MHLSHRASLSFYSPFDSSVPERRLQGPSSQHFLLLFWRGTCHLNAFFMSSGDHSVWSLTEGKVFAREGARIAPFWSIKLIRAHLLVCVTKRQRYSKPRWLPFVSKRHFSQAMTRWEFLRINNDLTLPHLGSGLSIFARIGSWPSRTVTRRTLPSARPKKNWSGDDWSAVITSPSMRTIGEEISSFPSAAS